MRKTFKLQDIDCANCAAKMEKAINKIDMVDECSINFISQKITIDANEEVFDQVLVSAQKAISKIERGCKILK